jgi:hypothetical protein
MVTRSICGPDYSHFLAQEYKKFYTLSVRNLGIAFLAASLSSALTGCSSASSLEDQARLIEYEKCLSAEEQQFLLAAQRVTNESLGDFLTEQKKEGALVASFIEACKDFRPK